MDVLSLRMEGPYAKVLAALSQRFRVRTTHHDRAAELGALARLYWTDLLLLGFEPAVGLDLLDECFYDPLLRVLPVAVAFGQRDAAAFDAVIGERKWLGARILPIAEPDFRSPWLCTLVGWHAARFGAEVVEARNDGLPADDALDDFTLPWEDGLGLNG